MDSGSFVFDSDIEQMVGLLLRKQAKASNAYWEYGGDIAKQLAFEIANRGLVAMGLSPEPMKPQPPEDKK